RIRRSGRHLPRRPQDSSRISLCARDPRTRAHRARPARRSAGRAVPGARKRAGEPGGDPRPRRDPSPTWRPRSGTGAVSRRPPARAPPPPLVVRSHRVLTTVRHARSPRSNSGSPPVMSHAKTDTLKRRHQAVRASLADQNLDALVVTSLPNILYLTNFTGSSAIVIVTGDRLELLTDFRYVTAVREFQREGADLELTTVEGAYDAMLVTRL